jgi:RNase P/RNase MRP subunit POP5
MKPLKPSFREKKRYLMLSGKFNRKEVEGAIMKYVGILGYAKASPMWISGKVLSINRGEINNVRGSFAFTENIYVSKVIGTLKGLRA